MMSQNMTQSTCCTCEPPAEKRQRVPSAYNRFIKEEIRRIKANNPDISHKEAFSTAAKNWAHFPNIHFGLGSHEGSKKIDKAMGAPDPQRFPQLEAQSLGPSADHFSSTDIRRTFPGVAFARCALPDDDGGAGAPGSPRSARMRSEEPTRRAEKRAQWRTGGVARSLAALRRLGPYRTRGVCRVHDATVTVRDVLPGCGARAVRGDVVDLEDDRARTASAAAEATTAWKKPSRWSMSGPRPPILYK
ncbi:hypothetical protein GUJ93_ZPchr0013g34055 [Zizania palustris]|uniref:YABBY protein C-terminal domain-containing protein n=1 Tax=Zizania palustris TaxID=103762 RepID=A0A8J5WX17_ZIZPA|nr:hypothetical protein GUJ93_ZPchr0013g34055 [Zizania palustris]